MSKGGAACREWAGVLNGNGLKTTAWRQLHGGLCYKNGEEMPEALYLSKGCGIPACPPRVQWEVRKKCSLAGGLFGGYKSVTDDNCPGGIRTGVIVGLGAWWV